MGRWEPDAQGRLQQAAMELFGTRGFEQTTVSDIATRAGLTERTFFRYYADKREVLFYGAEALAETMLAGLAAAPPTMAPIDAVGLALAAIGAILEERRPLAGRRQAIINANPELQEREQIKMSTLAASLANALRERGVQGSGADLAAYAGIAVFQLAFGRWVSGAETEDLPSVIAAAMTELKAVTAATS